MSQNLEKHLFTCAWNGTYFQHKVTELSKITKLCFQVVEKTTSEGTFLKTIDTLKTNLERIEYVAQYFSHVDVSSIIRNSKNGIHKSDTLAQKFREAGNDHYKKSSFAKALRGYNLASIFSETNGPELSLAFANRSALFYTIGEYKNCLQDILYAKLNNYPPSQMHKLDERIKKCLKALKLPENQLVDQEFVKNLTVPVQSKLIDQIKYAETELFNLKNPNPSIPTAEDFIQIEVNEERGRHVTFTKAVKPGTVVIVDQPYAKILLNDWKFDLNHCHYCHKEMNCGIPCPGCIFALFCNKDCYNSAIQSFHKYECNCAPLIYALHAPRTLLLAFRIICTLGPEEIYRIYSTKDSKYWDPNSSSSILGFDENIYDSLSYLPIYHLISHPDKCKSNEILSYVLSSLTMVSTLKEGTSFFSGSGYEQDEKFHQFVASLILLHMLNLPCNAHSLNELENFKEISNCADEVKRQELIKTSVVSEYGAGAFGVLSLINHSCDPNVFRANLHNGKTAVITLRSLKPGEELLDNYGVHFALHDSTERKSHLLENYYFDCTCIACKYNWPLLPDLKKLEETFVCTNFSTNEFTISQKLESRFLNHCILTATKPICTHCNKKYDLKDLIDSLDYKVDLFFYAHDLVLQNEPVKGIPLLQDCLEYFDSAILPPFIMMNDTQETMKQAMNLIVGSTATTM